jgi:thiosulfate/3-mercaptopyruvate sulfurtransferase
MRLWPALLAVLWIVILAQLSAAQEPGKLVSTQWLAENLARKDMRIVDMRDDIRDYWQSHIPGAVYLNQEALRWPEGGVPGKLIPPEDLVNLLGRMGISPSTLVIVYSDKNGYIPLYLVWALDYLAHKPSALLDGGFEKWKKESRPVTQDYPRMKTVVYRMPAKLNTEVRATLEEVQKGMAAGAVLLDVRPVELYSGNRGFWKRKGHIRGALSHFWSRDLTDEGMWKSKEELLKTYEQLGVTPSKTIIVSCGQGQMASHTYFTLKYILGFPRVKNYDGGYNEWSNRDDLPVETGIK